LARFLTQPHVPSAPGQADTRYLPRYHRHLSRPQSSRYIDPMSAKTKTRTHCAQCDQIEDRCECEKYCVLCQSQLDVRLCTDGLYYCEPCREACEYKIAD
jgi:hypothetical protein